MLTSYGTASLDLKQCKAVSGASEMFAVQLLRYCTHDMSALSAGQHSQ